MPAPAGPMLKSLIEAKMPPTHIKAEWFQKFLTALTSEVSTKWSQWILSMAWGANTVQGAGIGAWAGVGNGGTMHASPYTISADNVFSMAGFRVRTPATKKFIEALNTVLGQKFDGWVGSYKFNGNPYIGTCSASAGESPAPGPFNATNVPMPLIGMGQGTNPASIQKAWEAILESAPDPIFRLSNPNCHTKLFTNAVSSTIEEQFIATFLAQSMGVGDQVQGVGAPASGSGSAKSQATGKVV